MENLPEIQHKIVGIITQEDGDEWVGWQGKFSFIQHYWISFLIDVEK